MIFQEFWEFITTPPFVHLFIFALALFTLGIIGRLLSGFRPNRTLSHTAAVCFSIIFVYVVSIAAAGENVHMQIFTAALPYMNNIVDGTSLALLIETDFLTFLVEMTQIFFLGLTVSILKLVGNKIIKPFNMGLFSNIRKFFLWYIVECFVVIIAMVINYGVDVVLTELMGSAVAKWLPVIIFIALAIVMLLLFLKLIFKTVAFFALPIFGILTSFFGDNPIGKTIKTSFLTTLIITAALVVMSAAGVLMPIMTIVYPALIFGTAIMLIILIAFITWVFCC